MNLNRFNRVLVNSLWKRVGDDLSTTKAVYRFKVDEYKHINYAVNVLNNTIASSAYPHDLEDFQPEILTCREGWKRWFRPWVCEPNVLELINIFYVGEIDPICHAEALEIVWQAYLGNTSLTVQVRLDRQGRALSARLETSDALHCPDEYYNPVRTIETLPEIVSEARLWMEETEEVEFVY